MSSQIRVRGRKELILLDDNKARAIKSQWIDGSVPRSTIVDLGRWVGSLAEIKDIFTQIEPSYRQEIDQSQYYMSVSEWLTKSQSEIRDYATEWFLFLWSSRNFRLHATGREALAVDERALGEYYEIAFSYYRRNPHDALCPVELFAHLLPGYVAPVLAESVVEFDTVDTRVEIVDETF